MSSTAVKLINGDPSILQLQIQGKTWLLLGDLKDNQLHQRALAEFLPKLEVLWCGGTLDLNLVKALRPAVAIASAATVEADTAAQLRQSNTKLFLTERQGAIQWTPTGGFETKPEATQIDILPR